VGAAQPSAGEPSEWRPRRASQIAAAICTPLCLAFCAAVILAVFGTSSKPVTIVFALVVCALSLLIAAQTASVPAMRIRIAGNQLEYRNLLWSRGAVPLASVIGVTAAPRGLVISRSDGSEVVAHALTSPFPWSKRAASTAEQIQEAAAQWRRQWS
jgi:hypothetical protein